MEEVIQEVKTKEYPAFVYHAKKKAVIVNSKEEEEALGNGWADSPAKFKSEPTSENSAIPLESLKVEELKLILVTDYEFEDADLNGSKKDDLIKLIKDSKVA